MAKLVLTSLEKALKSLEKVLHVLERLSGPQLALKTELRDSAIQRFEYSYELCFKFIKRQLEQMSPHPSELDEVSFRDLLRRAGEAGLVREVEAFMRYRQARNLTIHAYEEEKAEEVYALLPGFLKEAQFLLAQLKKRNAS